MNQKFRVARLNPLRCEDRVCSLCSVCILVNCYFYILAIFYDRDGQSVHMDDTTIA